MNFSFTSLKEFWLVEIPIESKIYKEWEGKYERSIKVRFGCGINYS